MEKKEDILFIFWFRHLHSPAWSETTSGAGARQVKVYATAWLLN